MLLKQVKLAAPDKIRNGKEVQQVLDTGVDFVTIGRSAILHHDFPTMVRENPIFVI